MQKAFIIILKAAAIASIAAACAQGPLLLSKSLWVAGKWASSEARSIRALPGPDPTPDPSQSAPPSGDLAGPVPSTR